MLTVLKFVCFVNRSGTDSDGDIIKDGISVHSWQDHDENDNEVSYFYYDLKREGEN